MILMKNSAPISGRMVSSDAEFVVFSHTWGVLAEEGDFDRARRTWETELARHAERGRDSDALLFQWSEGHWALCGSSLCGSLYDLDPMSLASHA
jgi:hypothetical protein